MPTKQTFRSKKGTICGRPNIQRERERESERENLSGETGRRKYRDDGSIQGTCQSLEVISCWTEDFYGILSDLLTSHCGEAAPLPTPTTQYTHTHP